LGAQRPVLLFNIARTAKKIVNKNKSLLQNFVAGFIFNVGGTRELSNLLDDLQAVAEWC